MHYNNEPDYTFSELLKTEKKLQYLYLHQNTENHPPAAAERGLFVRLARRGHGDGHN